MTEGSEHIDTKTRRFISEHHLFIELVLIFLSLLLLSLVLADAAY